MAAGLLLAATPAKAPDVSINVAKRNLFPGESSYYEVVADTRDIPTDHISGVIQETWLPTAISSMTHTIFSDGGDTWGVYQDGFFETFDVSGGNLISDISGYSQVGIPVGQGKPLGPVGGYDEVVRFNFTVGESTQYGTSHFITLNPDMPTRFLVANGGPPQSVYPTVQQDPNCNNSFTIVPNQAEFNTCIAGPSQTYTTGDPCRIYDFDGDHDVDLEDFAETQRFYTTQE